MRGGNIKSDGYAIGPAVWLNSEKEVEQNELQAGWETVEIERDEEWDLI